MTKGEMTERCMLRKWEITSEDLRGLRKEREGNKQEGKEGKEITKEKVTESYRLRKWKGMREGLRRKERKERDGKKR